MTRFEHILVGLVMLVGVPLWSQVDNMPNQPAPAPTSDNSDNNSDNNDTRMVTPPPVNGQAYPVAFTAEERSNYLRGGVAFTSAYSNNVLGFVVGHPVNEMSYSVGPVLALNTTTPREHLQLSYAPGFTFYQRTTALNEADQNVAIDFEYRLSQHVTFSARDSFQRSSNIFNQPDLASVEAVSGGAQGANFSVIAPFADRLSNFGNAGVSYQFSPEGMIGAAGTFSNLHYPDPTQVPGLYDTSSQAGLAFYAIRIFRMHYLGVTYEYQKLFAYPAAGLNETQTHAALLFYTINPISKFSISCYGGPQYANTVQPPLPSQPQPTAVRTWTPAAGASMSWQGRLNSLAMGYSHIIASGGGLIGAVLMDSGIASLRRQLTRTLTGSVVGSYVQNNVLSGMTQGGTNGHSIQGTASLLQLFGQHMIVQLGYTRLHQDYKGVDVLTLTPNTNREFVSLSYQFSRPLGR